jgi:hypothetical protein
LFLSPPCLARGTKQRPAPQFPGVTEKPVLVYLPTAGKQPKAQDCVFHGGRRKNNKHPCGHWDDAGLTADEPKNQPAGCQDDEPSGLAEQKSRKAQVFCWRQIAANHILYYVDNLHRSSFAGAFPGALFVTTHISAFPASCQYNPFAELDNP